jgi:PAS domain S-box-containing protein
LFAALPVKPLVNFIAQAFRASRLRIRDVSIRTQTILLVAIILTPPGVALFYHRNATERATEARAIEEVGELAQEISQAEARQLENGQSLLDILSDIPAIRNFDAPACQTILSALRSDDPTYLGFAVFRADGSRVCGSNSTPKVYSEGDRSWFRLALANKRFSVGEYQAGAVTGLPSIGIAKPLLGSGDTVSGVIYAALSLDWLSDSMLANTLPEDSSFLLVDRAGTILRRWPEYGTATGSSLVRDQLFAAMRSKPTGYAEVLPGVDGRQRLYHIFRLGGSPNALVYAAIGIPLDTIRSSAERRMLADIAILGIAAVVMIGIGYLLGKHLWLIPLERLAAFSREIGAGRLDAKTGLGGWRNEIGELARNLDRMAASLLAYQTEASLRTRLILESEQAGQIGSWQWRSGSATFRCTPELARIFRLDRASGSIAFRDALDRIHPDDRENLNATLAGLNTAGREQAEFRLLFASGEVRHCTCKMWIAGHEGEDALIHGFTQDITDRKRAEAEKERNAHFLEAMLDNISEGIIACDAGGDIVVFNRALEQLHGRALDSLRGINWEDDFAIYRPDGEVKLKKHERPLWRALSGERLLNEEIIIKTAKGNKIRALANAQEIRSGAGERLGAVVTARDISKLRRAEIALRQAQKMEAVGVLSGGIAHDFNNLLSVVIGNLDALLLRLQDEKHREIATDALDAALRGVDLVKRMQAFARQRDLDSAPIQVSDVIRAGEATWRRELGPISLRTSFTADLWQCMADPGELQACMLYLISNARDAIDGSAGAVTIEARNERVDEAYAVGTASLTAGDYVMISVSDTGTGIPPQNLGRVTEPFFTTKEPGKGTGLGLSMVYGFVKQSNGHLRIYSELGHGTTVSLYLPRAALEHEHEPVPQDGLPASNDQAVTLQKSALVVDDDAEVRTIAVTLLAELGLDVIEASGADEAVQILGQARTVDLLLSDVVMPGEKSGFDLAEYALENFPDMKIILLTGFAENAARGRSSVTERVELLSKPYRRTDLADRIVRLLQQ